MKETAPLPIESRDVPFANGNWRIFFGQEYGDTLDLAEGGAAWKALRPLVEGGFAPFRCQLNLDGINVLAAIFPAPRQVRLCSARLGRELFVAGEEDFVREVAELDVAGFPSVWEVATRTFGLPDMGELELEGEGKELLRRMRAYRPSLFERLSDLALNLSANYALLRVHLLKFLAALPALDYDCQGGEVKRVLLESLRRLTSERRRGAARPLPPSVALAAGMFRGLCGLFPPRPLAFLVRSLVRFSARRFIAGESIDEARQALQALRQSGRDATLDRLGELVVSEAEADGYTEEVLSMIAGLARQIPRGERNPAGINRAHVSIKVSALCSDFRPEAFEATYARVAPRLVKILASAKGHEVFVNIDAEHYRVRDLTFQIYRKVLLETEELADYADTGIVLQAYLRDGAAHFADILALARERKLPMPVRLVKGAYWDAETVEAAAHSFDAPEFLNKEETDLHYRQLAINIFQSHPHLRLCLAGHNLADHCFAEARRARDFPHLPPIEHQCLHMTYEALSVGMARMGWVVRNYVPVGSLLVGMAYLVRRIMENSSQVGVLTMMRSHHSERALRSPVAAYREKRSSGKWIRDPSQIDTGEDFVPAAPLRLDRPAERESFWRALEGFRQEGLGRDYRHAFALSGPVREIRSPSDPAILVGRCALAEPADADQAVEQADQACLKGSWIDSGPYWRACVLLRAADLLLARRNELAWLITYEAGKTIGESLADVDEAIDFVSFYARQGRRHQGTARGVVAVISPWNFPLAIPCGMISAPLAVGNSVILKSAEQTPLVACRLVEIFHQAGVPRESLIHLPGLGESVGAALVEHPRVAAIAFTGSKAVGLAIAARAGRRFYQNRRENLAYPVKVVAEMGGKNAIIVTANAEPDETVAGILSSAFGHAGQKCSAASRVIVDERVKDALLARLSCAIKDLRVGRSFEPDCAVNPLIREEDRQRLRRAWEDICREAVEFGGRIVVDRSREDLPGWCFGPCLVELPLERAMHPDSHARQELFGPILHVIPYRDLREALRVFNSTDYALTGGVFAQSQDDIDELTRRMEAGNIYVNRNITGARVAIEPFGGFKFSGTGPKAGSARYLDAFCVVPSGQNRQAELTDLLEEGEDFDLRVGQEPKPMALRRGLSLLEECFEAEGDRQLLRRYRRWLEQDLDWRLANYKIPGQISFCDFSLPRECALLVAARPCGDVRALIQALGVLAAGTGLTVACCHRQAWQWWTGLFARLPEFALRPRLCSVDILREKLRHPLLSLVMVDGPRAVVEELLPHLHLPDEGACRMRSLWWSDVQEEGEDFAKSLANSVWVRSFSVNTMRHGAPFELES